MKMSWRWLAILAVLLCATQAPAAKHVRVIQAGGNSTPLAKPKEVPYWTVDAVDLDGKSVTLIKSDGKDSEKYKVTALTKIIINGQPDKLENVQPGMKAVSTTLGAGSLSSLSVVKSKESSDKKK